MRIPLPRSWWARLALGAKMLLVAGLPLLVAAVAVPVLYSTQRSAGRVGDTVEHVYRARQHLAAVLQDLVDAETGVRGYLLTGEAAFLEPYRVGLDRLPEDLAKVRREIAVETGVLAERQDHLVDLVDERVQLIERTRTFAERTPAGTIPFRLLARGRRVMEDIRGTLDELDASQGQVLAARRAELASAEHMAFVVSVVVLLSLLGAVLASLLFARSLVRKVKLIESNARHLERGEPLEEAPNGSDELAALGRALAHAAARLAEQDAELRELALNDPLTGMHNRRAFFEIAGHELQVCRRRGSGTALIFTDVDGLKLVNDRYGHAEGDHMLQEAADVLRASLRDADVLARLGGDEFCILLSRDSAMDGTAVLERLDANLRELNAVPGRRYELALSFGLAMFDPASSMGVTELVEQADRAMYQQKHAKTTRPWIGSPGNAPDPSSANGHAGVPEAGRPISPAEQALA